MQQVRILNPVHSRGEFCTPKRAQRYVRSGRAERVSDHVIRMIAKDYRHLSAVNKDAEDVRRLGYTIASETGYINQTQARGIPFAGNVARMGLSA